MAQSPISGAVLFWPKAKRDGGRTVGPTYVGFSEGKGVEAERGDRGWCFDGAGIQGTESPDGFFSLHFSLTSKKSGGIVAKVLVGLWTIDNGLFGETMESYL